MSRFSFKKIKNKLLFWFLVLAIIPLIISFLIVYDRETLRLERETFDKLKAIRDLKADRVSSWVQERMGDLKTASTDFDLTDIEFILGNYTEEISESQKEKIIYKIREVLKAYLINYTEYEDIFILNPESGRVMISTREYLEGTDKSLNSYYKEVMETRDYFLKDVYYSNEINQVTMAFSGPIFCREHNHKHIVGVLVARLNLKNSLYQLLDNRTGLGKTGETLIVNHDVIALNRLRWNENSALNLKITAEPAVRAARGEEGIIKSLDYRGEEVLAAYTNIAETGWGFVCKQDLRELHEPLGKLLGVLIILLIVTSILIVFIGIVISKTISNPIVSLKKMAKAIETGNYSTRMNIDSNDELGSLSASVNSMADSIESQVEVDQGLSQVTKAIIGKESIKEFSEKLLQELMDLTSSEMGAFYALDERGEYFEANTAVGANLNMLQRFKAEDSEGEFGTAIAAGRIYIFEDIPEDTIFSYVTVAGGIKPKAIITIPIISGSKVIAMISLAKISRYSEESIDVINMSWALINQAYSNLLSSDRLAVMNEDLNKANEVLESQKEELQSQTEELHQQSEELQQTSNELQEQNLELEHQKKQLAQASKLKSQFLSNMSHELRTPLNSILALSEVLQQNRGENLSREEIKHLGIINKNGQRLLNLINDILDISKIEAGKLDVRIVPVSLKSTLRDVYELIKPLAEKKDINFKMELPDKLPIIETDSYRLTQILQNLADNAVKFTEKGYVRIFTELSDGEVKIHIEDTGIGISEEKLKQVFEEFRQVDGSVSRQFEGTGLGLSIAKKLAIMLGGDIELESELGEGSKFSLRLPLKWDGMQTYEKSGIKLEPLKKFIPNRLENNESHRLLIVEDNEAAIIQVQNALQRKGYEVDVVRNGIEALSFVEHTIPDGIILDLMMPEMDGFEVLERMRSTARTRNIPVLILTAKDLDESDFRKLSANNVQQLVQKGDVNLEGLYKKVSIMLSAGMQNRESQNEQHEETDKKRILIIEDNPDNMETVKAIIPEKHICLEAEDGLIGLRKAISEKPDLILLDINLPQIDGIELVGIIKGAEELRDIPVIAITARASEGDKEELLKYGCDDYLAKPLKPELLLEKINKWIDEKSKSREKKI